jgi:Epoxide hydrolase N terminus
MSQIVPEAVVAVSGDKSIRPFRVEMSQADIDELRRRIQATRWPEQETVADQSQGVRLVTMRSLPAARGPRQHHDDVDDEHGRVVRPPLLAEQARFLRPQGGQGSRRRQRFPRELYQAPRSWMEKAYAKLIYFNELGRGNHFAAWQEPELLTNELRAAFRSVRDQSQSQSQRRSS